MNESKTKVMVFPARTLEEAEGGKFNFSGFRRAEDAEESSCDYLELIAGNYRFAAAEEAERNQSWKQPFVYAVVVNPEYPKVFACRSMEDAKKGRMMGEEIFGSYNFGLGDNVLRSDEFARDEHVIGRGVVENALARILDYGFDIRGNLTKRVFGFINNLSKRDDEVILSTFGRTHFGIVCLVETDSINAGIKDNSLEGKFYSFEEIMRIASSAQLGRETGEGRILLDEWSIAVYRELVRHLGITEEEEEQRAKQLSKELANRKGGRRSHPRHRRRHGKGDIRRG